MTSQPKDEHRDIIDTSGMSEEKATTMDLVEGSRDQSWEGATFTRDIFLGKMDLDVITPFPEQPEDDRKAGDDFLEIFSNVLREHIDPNEIDKTGEIPDSAIEAIANIGAFGIKIKKDYGGLGLSQTNYLRAGMLMGSWCANTAALISAHQSIGVPQPILVFGTEDQKKRFLPRCAKGEISAFALTETGVGSDPAKLETSATLSEDGKHWILNGEKLWCTNVIKASLIVVMARTPDKEIRGKMRRQVTAMVVDMDTPGVEILHRCRFMGLKALYNGVIRFTDAKVPVENVIGEEGRGLKIALTTLNTGRLTMSGSCTGAAKRCLEWVKEWSNAREQWGSSIGKHAAIADKIAKMAADIFAMESISLLTARMVDMKAGDIRLESAMCKMKTSEDSERIVNDTMQIRGGRGFETFDSLKARGDRPMPVEQLYRDCRINTIFEGSSEIMRLLIAREALDPHLSVAGDAMNTRLPMSARIKAAFKALGFYVWWYPTRWLPVGASGSGRIDPQLRRHVNRAGRTSRRLARTMFHAMARYGPALEKQHIQLRRIVDIGTELFTIAATCSHAQSLFKKTGSREYLDLADLYSRNAFLRIEDWFEGSVNNQDRENYKLAQRVLGDDFKWLFDGIV